MIKRVGVKRVMAQMEGETSLCQSLVHGYIQCYPQLKNEIISKAYELEEKNPNLNRTSIPSWYHHGVNYKVMVWVDGGGKREDIAVLNISTGGDEIWYTNSDGKSMHVSQVFKPHLE